jgi:small subunit ribosomal protein S1
VSDSNGPGNKQGGGGGDGMGPKKPRATFGDVMLGIPSGNRDDKGGGGRGGGTRPDRPERGPRPERQEGAPSGDAPKGDGSREQGGQRRERGGGGGGGGGGRDRGPRREDRKPQGPMVVVKRATGQVETRPLEPATGTVTATPDGAVKPAAEAAGDQAPTPTPTPTPAPAHVPSSALYEPVPENETFADMFEASQKQEGANTGRRQVRIGEKVKGKIFQLGADTAFVSLGGKSEAMIELRELQDDEGVLRHGVGDEIEAHVIEAGARGIVLSKAITKGSASMAMLAEARASGMPVEGMVLGVNKGGVEVAVGDVRAFCPISQLDLRFVEKPDQFVGEKLKFRVMEVRERNVVLSRRALLEEEQRAQAAETRKKISEGVVLKGKVTSVRDFGAFVDLGGIEGMIPVSEMSHVRIGHPSEVVKQGDDVEVEVIRMEPPQPNSPDKAKQKERITLSMRSRMEDPWKAAAAEIQEGARIKGKVVRLQPFGAFVELRPGVDGLIHISALSERRIAHPRDVVQVGQEVFVHVEKVDPDEKRVGLRLISEEEASRPAEEKPAAAAPKKEAEPQAPRPKAGQVVVGKVDRIESYGVFVQFPGGKGLVPASETGTDRGTDLKRVFSLGQEVKAAVLEIDPTGKIRLSITGAQRAEERAEVEAWAKTQKPAGGGKQGFGTFADLLKNKKL